MIGKNLDGQRREGAACGLQRRTPSFVPPIYPAGRSLEGDSRGYPKAGAEQGVTRWPRMWCPKPRGTRGCHNGLFGRLSYRIMAAQHNGLQGAQAVRATRPEIGVHKLGGIRPSGCGASSSEHDHHKLAWPYTGQPARGETSTTGALCMKDSKVIFEASNDSCGS